MNSNAPERERFSFCPTAKIVFNETNAAVLTAKFVS